MANDNKLIATVRFYYNPVTRFYSAQLRRDGKVVGSSHSRKKQEVIAALRYFGKEVIETARK